MGGIARSYIPQARDQEKGFDAVLWNGALPLGKQDTATMRDECTGGATGLASNIEVTGPVFNADMLRSRTLMI